MIGDIHGHKKRFLAALDSVRFNPTRDRLFSVGDLVDYGEQSLFILDYLKEEWFFAIRGNHEEMIINRFESPIAKPPYMNGVQTQHEATKEHQANGGKWFDKLKHDSAREDIYRALRRLPYAITLETKNGPVGLVHAEVPEQFHSWGVFLDNLETDSSVRKEAIWSRLAIMDVYDPCDERMLAPDECESRTLDGVSATFHGHTRTPIPVTCGNQNWIDTGEMSDALTILEV